MTGISKEAMKAIIKELDGKEIDPEGSISFESDNLESKNPTGAILKIERQSGTDVRRFDEEGRLVDDTWQPSE